MIKRVSILVIIGLALSPVVSPAGGAGLYVFTKIADNTGPFGTMANWPSINSSGQVTFVSALDVGGSGRYVGSGGPVTTIADDSGPLNTFFGAGNIDVGSINSAGTVAFRANHDTLGAGVFTSSGGAPTMVYDTSGPIAGFVNGVSINSSGLIAFDAVLDSGAGGGEGIYTGSGGAMTTIAHTSGVFSGFSGLSAPINDAGEVAFKASLDGGGSGIFKGSGGPVTTIASTTGGSGVTFVGSSPSINDAGVVAFSGVVSGVEGIYTGSGGALTAYADTADGFSGFYPYLAMNNLGVVAFKASWAGGAGIYVGTDPTVWVVRPGDTLVDPSKTVLGVTLLNEGINDAGQIAFWAMLSDGSEGIFLATPIPEPGSFGLLALGGLAWMRRRCAD